MSLPISLPYMRSEYSPTNSPKILYIAPMGNHFSSTTISKWPTCCQLTPVGQPRTHSARCDMPAKVTALGSASAAIGAVDLLDFAYSPLPFQPFGPEPNFAPGVSVFPCLLKHRPEVSGPNPPFPAFLDSPAGQTFSNQVKTGQERLKFANLRPKCRA